MQLFSRLPSFLLPAHAYTVLPNGLLFSTETLSVQLPSIPRLSSGSVCNWEQISY